MIARMCRDNKWVWGHGGISWEIGGLKVAEIWDFLGV